MDGLTRIDANDMEPAAVAAIQRNVDHNGGAAAELVRPMQNDARMVMYQARSLYCLQGEALGCMRQFQNTS